MPRTGLVHRAAYSTSSGILSWPFVLVGLGAAAPLNSLPLRDSGGEPLRRVRGTHSTVSGARELRPAGFDRWSHFRVVYDELPAVFRSFVTPRAPCWQRASVAKARSG